MRKLRLICLLLLAVLIPGCKPGTPKELTKAQRSEIGMLAGEAEFATQVRDHARAEECWRKVIDIDDTSSDHWLQLGFSCRRQDKKGDAKSAYKKALALREARFKREKTAENLLSQIEPLGLLGREADARKVLDKAQRDFPEERLVKAWVEQKLIDRLLSDLQFKSLMI